MADVEPENLKPIVDIVMPIVIAIIAGLASYFASYLQIRQLKQRNKSIDAASLALLKDDLKGLHEKIDSYFIDVQSDISNNKSLNWVGSMDMNEPPVFSQQTEWRTVVSGDQNESISNIRIKLSALKSNIPGFLRARKTDTSKKALADSFQECLNTIEYGLEKFGMEGP